MSPSKNFKIFDAHTHAFPDKIAARAIETGSAKAHIPAYHDGSFAGLCKYEENGGADAFLLLPIATNPASVRSVNDWAASKQGGKTYAFGSIHPEMADYKSELDYIVSLGLRGIKMHPEYQVFFVDDKHMFPIYEAVFERGLIISFHAGVDLGFPPPVRGDARRIARVCDAFPDGRIIAAHMGGMSQYDIVRETLVGRDNLWMDTSFASVEMTAEEICALVKQHGAHRFLFGTDAPWRKFEASKNAILHSGLPDDALAAIFFDNAANLLGFDGIEFMS